MNTHLSGGTCVKDIVNELELESPEIVRATLVCQYAATVSQVLNLKSNEMEWVADHLGVGT